MPIPGPRYQDGVSIPGYRNPGLESPDRINLWDRPPPVADPGRTPGLMIVTRRGCVLVAGQIRRMWRQSVGLIPATPPYSWTQSAPRPGQGMGSVPPPFHLTRALRYMTRSVYMGQGIDNTRFEGMHTVIKPKARGKQVTLAAGSVRSRPTVRNRMTSFGSRVPTLNQPVQGAATDQPS